MFTPGGKRSIAIRHARIPIKSFGEAKYEELSNISKQMLSMTVVPDFGEGYTNPPEFREFGGWKVFYDYIKKEPRFEKL